MPSTPGPSKRYLSSIAYSSLKSLISFIDSAELQRAIAENLLPIANSIAELYERNRAAFDNAISASRELAELAQSTTIAISSHMSQSLSSMDAFSRAISDQLASFRITFRAILDTEAIRRFREQLKLDEKTAEAFKEANWPIAPSMTMELRNRVIELHSEGKVGYATQSIIGFYRKNNHANLVAMVGRWKKHPLFTQRIHIIEDALQAHMERRYTLSVPALIPQIEGILSEYVARHGSKVQLGKPSQVYQAAIGDPEAHSWYSWPYVACLLYHLENNTYAYADFEHEIKRAARRRKITRHTLMHGIAIGYDRHMHSLRAFLLLDSISVLELGD